MALNFLNNGYFAGKVGIGTVSPDSLLQVGANLASDGVAYIGDYNSSFATNFFYRNQTAAQSTVPMMLVRQTNTNDDQPVLVLDQDGTGDILQAFTDTSQVVTIDYEGNVGIGTTNPGYKLSVDDNTVTTVPKTLLQFDSGNIADNGGYNIDFRVSSNNTADRFVSRIRGIRESTGALSQLSFWTESGSALEQRMTIRASGKVGIGTTTPNAKLTIWDEGATFDVRTSGINVHRPSSYGQYGSFSYDGATTYLASTYTGNAALGYGTFVFKQYNNGTVGRNALEIQNDGNFLFNQYAGSALTGTPTYLLGTDASGNVVKTNTVPGSAAGPYLPLAGGTMIGDLKLNDAVQLKLGTSNDLRIYHSGTNSNIENNSGTLQIIQNLDDGDIVFKSDNGSGNTTPYFQLDGSHTQSIAWKDIHFVDGIKAKFGDYASPDLQIYHDSSDNNSYIKELGTGSLQIWAKDFEVYNADGTETLINADVNAGVQLYFDNSTKIATTSAGIAVTGGGTFTTSVTASGNSNSFGNTSIAALTATSGAFSASVTAAGNSNSFGVTTFTGNITANGYLTLTGQATPQLFMQSNTSGTPNWTLIASTNGTFTIGRSGVANDLYFNTSGSATFTSKAYGVAPITSDPNSTIATKGYVQSVITGATIYRGTWNPDVSLNSGYGNPNLNTVTQTSGYYYICSADGAATPNGTGNEPDSWNTGDWVIWNDDVGASGEWQKIDNSSVLSGVGTGQTVALWQGPNTVTDSETLGNAPITVNGNNSTFAGDITSAGLTVDYTGNRTGDAGILVTNDASDWGIKVDKDGTADYGILSQTDGENAIVVRNASGVNKIQLQGDGDASFAGDVDVNGGQLKIQGDFAKLLFEDTAGTDLDSYIVNNANGLFFGKTNSPSSANDILSLNLSTKAATFAGNVTVNSDSNAIGLRVNGRSSDDIAEINMYENDGTTLLGRIQTRTTEMFVGSITGMPLKLMTAGSVRMTVLSGGNVGIGTTSPNSKLQIVGKATSSSTVSTDAATTLVTKDYVDSSAGNPSYFRQGHKSHGLTNAFTTCLTVNLNSHTGCYVTVCCFGDWGSHSSAAYRGEFFLQNGANAYSEPGIILRQDDNTSNGADQIVCQILDPTSSSNPKDFEIQIRTTATTGTTGFTGLITFTVQGKFNSVT